MKMKQEHYDTLREAISLADSLYPSIRRQFDRDEISAERFRWDLLWASNSKAWVMEVLYPYLVDDHIDTALRRITNTK